MSRELSSWATLRNRGVMPAHQRRRASRGSKKGGTNFSARGEAKRAFCLPRAAHAMRHFVAVQRTPEQASVRGARAAAGFNHVLGDGAELGISQ